MTSFRNDVYAVMYKGSPLLVTPIGDQPVTTFLVDLEEVFVLLEKQEDKKGATYWTEFGKGETTLSGELGQVIEEKNRNTSTIG